MKKNEGKWTVEVIPDSNAGDALVQLIGPDGRLMNAARVSTAEQAAMHVADWLSQREIELDALVNSARQMTRSSLPPPPTEVAHASKE